MIRQFATLIGISFAVSTIAINSTIAGEADVVKVKVTQQSNGSYGFQVTVRHNDEGWDHYADAWDVISVDGGADGTVYATRVLAHPHENEQPFTRGKSGVSIPEGIKSVVVRAHDKVHGYGGETKEVALPGR